MNSLTENIITQNMSYSSPAILNVFNKPIFKVGVTGPSGSGKTTVCELITEEFLGRRIAVVSFDRFYKKKPEHIPSNKYNYDDIDAFDIDLAIKTLDALDAGYSVDILGYDYVTHAPNPCDVLHIDPAEVDVIIIEGIMLFSFEYLLSRFNIKVYVRTDLDTCLARRIKRDIRERGREVEDILEQYEKFVKPGFIKFIAPTENKADVIIPNVNQRLSKETVAVKMLLSYIREQFVRM